MLFPSNEMKLLFETGCDNDVILLTDGGLLQYLTDQHQLTEPHNQCNSVHCHHVQSGQLSVPNPAETPMGSPRCPATMVTGLTSSSAVTMGCRDDKWQSVWHQICLLISAGKQRTCLGDSWDEWTCEWMKGQACVCVCVCVCVIQHKRVWGHCRSTAVS